MFGFHWLELLVILPLIALILGPKRLPALGGALGRALRGFREGVAELQEESGIDEVRRDLSKQSDQVSARVEKLASDAQGLLS